MSRVLQEPSQLPLPGIFRHLHKPNFVLQVYCWWHLPWRLQQGETSLRFDHDRGCHRRALHSVTQHTWDLPNFQGVKAALLPVICVKLMNATASLSPSVWDLFWFLRLLSQNQTVSLLLFSWSVVSDSLQPHGLQHAGLPCPSASPGACSNSCPLSQWCHQNISSSVVSFSSCLQSFPASGSFPMSQLFISGGQRWLFISDGASASASVLPMNTQDWSPLGWTGWICLQSKGPSRVFSNTIVQKHQSFSTQPSLWSKSQIVLCFGKMWLLTRGYLVPCPWCAVCL